MKDRVIEFIKRRFKSDCNWISGNCCYFAMILKTRFPDGVIFYDVINGHFVFNYADCYYDYTGIITPDENNIIEWDIFGQYDSLQRERIIRDCIL